MTHAKPTDFASYPEPRLSKLLFASRASVPLWTIVHLYLGYLSGLPVAERGLGQGHQPGLGRPPAESAARPGRVNPVTPTALVAYATRYGSTQEIAARIGAVLERGGVRVGVRPADEVTRVRGYDAVVLGSGVYSAGWLPDATELLESFQEDLAHKPEACKRSASG